MNSKRRRLLLIIFEKLGVGLRIVLVRSCDYSLHLYEFMSCCLFFSQIIIFIFVEMWAKNVWNFSHSNQETNASIKSYYCHVKSRYLCDCSKNSTRRMNWLIHVLLPTVEPFCKSKRFLQFYGFLTNFKKEWYYKTTLERLKNDTTYRVLC